MMKRVISAFWLIGGWCAVAKAEVPSSETAVEQYRIQSHYGPDEALLKPIFSKQSKLELGGGATISPLSSIHDSWSYSGSLIWHINRRHSVEPLYFFSNSNSLSSFVQSQIADRSEVSDSEKASLSVTMPKQGFLASYFFTPWHAKLHLSSQTVSHFDIYLGAGLGGLQSEQWNLNGSVLSDRWQAAGVITAGMRLLYQPRFALRLEVRDIIYGQDNFARKGTGHQLQMGAALSIFFGSF